MQYETFCSKISQLQPLVVRYKESVVLMRDLNTRPILSIKPGDQVFLDLRAIGAGWYDSLQLPNCDFMVYVVPLIYKSWGNSQQTRINCMIPSLRIEWRGRSAVNHFFVKSWGLHTILTDNMTLATNDFITQHNLISKSL